MRAQARPGRAVVRALHQFSMSGWMVALHLAADSATGNPAMDHAPMSTTGLQLPAVRCCK
jgi:hypothetical protein